MGGAGARRAADGMKERHPGARSPGAAVTERQPTCLGSKHIVNQATLEPPHPCFLRIVCAEFPPS